jgi:glyoxylase-like metal-dependent hydrolase (beta-lactamase superfamily II)
MNIGDYRISVISDCEFRLDGGAMFGVVPRVFWEKACPPDELNRIRLNMNCLFIETRDDKILVDTGIGEKWTDRQSEIYGIYRKKSFTENLFGQTGCRPEDISIVINTHLHFDHAGGNTIQDEKGVARPQFCNARYFVSRRELNHAENPHERDRASYLPENWDPLITSGQIELKDDNYEAVDGLAVETVRGHSETMQTVRLCRGGQTLFCFADLIPTHNHLNPAWIMGYDLFPVETLEFKKAVLPQAVRENWLCLFYHDFDLPLCRIRENNGKFSAAIYDSCAV